jgi:hypothetical protein
MKLTDDYCENYEKNMDERELLMLKEVVATG